MESLNFNEIENYLDTEEDAERLAASEAVGQQSGHQAADGDAHEEGHHGDVGQMLPVANQPPLYLREENH